MAKISTLLTTLLENHEGEKKMELDLGPVPLEVRNCLIFLLWRDESKMAMY